MPFIHLPVQSGSNKILKLMNRKHTIEEYLNIYEKLKKINTNIEFSSDFIIGYPGENDQDFKDTLELVKKIKFINSYSFVFSSRPGTVADNLDSINRDVAHQRLELIQKELFKNQKDRNHYLENKIVTVLVENQMKNQEKLFGRTEHMTSVIFNGDKKNIANVVLVKINKSNHNSLYGDIQPIKDIKAA